MTRLFAALGRFAVRFRWAVVAAWVAAAVLATLFLPSLDSVTSDSSAGDLPASARPRRRPGWPRRSRARTRPRSRCSSPGMAAR